MGFRRRILPLQKRLFSIAALGKPQRPCGDAAENATVMVMTGSRVEGFIVNSLAIAKMLTL